MGVKSFCLILTLIALTIGGVTAQTLRCNEFNQLPTQIQSGIQKKVDSNSIKKIETNLTKGGTMVYQVEIQKKFSNTRMVFSDTGELIYKTRLKEHWHLQKVPKTKNRYTPEGGGGKDIDIPTCAAEILRSWALNSK